MMGMAGPMWEKKAYLLLYFIVDLKIPLKINSQLYKAGYILI